MIYLYHSKIAKLAPALEFTAQANFTSPNFEARGPPLECDYMDLGNQLGTNLSGTFKHHQTSEISQGVDNRIRVLREARGFSLEALADAAGTSNQQISLLETGKRRLTVDWLLRLASALTCHPWELVSEDLPRRLDARDIRLLNRFQGLTELQQTALLRFLDAFVPDERRQADA